MVLDKDVFWVGSNCISNPYPASACITQPGRAFIHLEVNLTYGSSLARISFDEAALSCMIQAVAFAYNKEPIFRF
eukprot:6204342-Pleurochrysis_carterae.AAC.9